MALEALGDYRGAAAIRADNALSLASFGLGAAPAARSLLGLAGATTESAVIGARLAMADFAESFAGRSLSSRLERISYELGVGGSYVAEPKFVLRGLKSGEGSATAFIDFNAVNEVAPGLYRADPRQLRFMQPTVSPNYSAGGHTIVSTAEDLRLGRVTPDQLGDPLRVVMIDGKPFSFDNRRIVSYNLAGARNVPVQVMGLDDPVFAAKVDLRLNPIQGEGLQVVVTPSSDRNSVIADLYRRGMLQKRR